MKLSKKQREVLAELVDGADPKTYVDSANAHSPALGAGAARTMVALYRAGAIEIAESGDLEVTEAGMAAIEKVRRP